METDEESRLIEKLGLYNGKVKIISNEDPAEEIALLWCIQQPLISKNNAFVQQSSLKFSIDACGRSLSVLQSPSSLGTAGVTGSVMWDSGIVLGKFLEHAVDSGAMILQGKKVIELGSGCGLVGSVAALLGAHTILTDLPDRLKLLKKNVEANLYGNVKGSAKVDELTWGYDLDLDLYDPYPEYVIGSDLIYGEEGVTDLLDTLSGLCGNETTIILASELRNDAILEFFLEAARKVFVVGCIDQKQWHPDYCSQRVVMFVLVRQDGYVSEAAAS